MFNSAALEVALGIVLVFLLVSTVCTAMREGIESFFKTRAAYLEAGIRELLADVEGTGIAPAFFNHPLIYSLYSGQYQPGARKRSTLESGRNLPSYISGRSFAMALLDIVARGPSTDVASGSPDLPPATLASVRHNVGHLGNPRLQRMVILAIDSADGDMERAVHNLHTWYDESMGRVSGWYKRSTQKVLFVIALGVVSVLNVNTISIAQYLYRNDSARAQLVAAAEQTAAGDLISAQVAKEQLMEASLPLGWSQGYGAPVVKHWDARTPFDFWNDVVGSAAGLLITIFAAMLGAPLWFDVLGRVTTIRATFKPRVPLTPAQEHPVSQVIAAREIAPTSSTVRITRTAEVTTFPGDHDEGDACDHRADEASGEVTHDEELPVARGGVAS